MMKEIIQDAASLLAVAAMIAGVTLLAIAYAPALPV